MAVVSLYSQTYIHGIHPNSSTEFRINTCLNLIHDQSTKLPTLRPPIKIRRPPKIVPTELPIPNNRPNSNPARECSKNGGGHNKSCTSSDVLRLMDSLGFVVTPDIYALLIDECTQEGNAAEALELSEHMNRNRRTMNFLRRPYGSSLINRVLIMYVSCGCMNDAHQLFDKMPQRDFISWTIMISSLVQNEFYAQALSLFVQMHRRCFKRNDQTDDGLVQLIIGPVIRACEHTGSLQLGKLVHGWLMKSGYEIVPSVATSLMGFYGKFDFLCDANSVFLDQIQVSDCHDLGLWTSAIVNNCRENRLEEVMRIFNEMGRLGIQRNETTFSSVLRACARTQDDACIWSGKQVHANAVKLGTDTLVFVQCSLVDMYGRKGSPKEARRVFDAINSEVKNGACWNALLNVYIKQGMCVEAVMVLYEMEAVGVEPQESSLNGVRIVCGGSGWLCKGLAIAGGSTERSVGPVGKVGKESNKKKGRKGKEKG